MTYTSPCGQFRMAYSTVVTLTVVYKHIVTIREYSTCTLITTVDGKELQLAISYAEFMGIYENWALGQPENRIEE